MHAIVVVRAVYTHWVCSISSGKTHISTFFVIAGIWIVSVEWVIDSMDKHCIQAEATYEVRKNAKATEHFAPHRARLAAAYLAEQAQVPIISVYVLAYVSKRLLIGRDDNKFWIILGGQCFCFASRRVL